MLKHTALHDLHVKSGARMGEFAGYDMPLYYGEGVIKEHLWVREACGMFDVSHMGQVTIEGEGVAEFLERLTPSPFQEKRQGKAQYTVLTNEQGGIIDDLIITRLSEHQFFAVINAGCKEKDIAWVKEHLPSKLTLNYMEERALIALQGPKAAKVLEETLQCDVSDLPYMNAREGKSPCGKDILISRLGYTGEDGFELSVPPDVAQRAWQGFSKHPAVKPIGLAARDSLRLEMGYALYGHEITAETSPVEAGLNWVMGKNASGYFGCERIQKELSEGTARKLVGVKLTDKGIAREGAEIQNGDGKVIGVMTSGGHSPSLQAAIGMAYIDTPLAEAGQDIFVNVRGRNLAALVADLPFVPAKTKSMKKAAA
ncbi:MAG: glycine cleavage system aminomethyltransferase GcvT [Rhodospirillales bacterium]|nr:glycine cleavage system aminomethyltransferase GcvT [Rhodospirillales bacterium]